MQTFFLFLLIFVPIALVGNFLHLSSTLLFFLCALAIIPLAKYIGEATEELAGRTSAAVGGLLNATFGNATEFIIGIFALHAGLIEVVKASITGSIIGNLLLVLGSAMFLGGRKRQKQTFNMTVAQAGGSTLLVAVIALTIPAVFLWTASNGTISSISPTVPIETLSIIVSLFMITTYVASLFFSLKTHKKLYIEEVEKYEPKWSTGKSIAVLLVATLFVAWISNILVGSIQSVVTQFNWSELFVGVVFVAIIGNIAEHVSSVTVAIKNRMDLAIQIAAGSATQIIMLITPLLVLVSLFFAIPMNLVFNAFELIAIIFAVFIANSVVADGESNWFEGVQLIMAYAIIAISFYFHS